MTKITQLDVSAFTIPTDFPEADGTIEWNSTTIVIVEAHAGGQIGTGFTYGDRSAAGLIRNPSLCIAAHSVAGALSFA